MEIENDIQEYINLIKEQILFDNEKVMEKLIGIGPIAKVYKLDFEINNIKLALKIIPKTFQKNLIMPYLNFLKNFKKPFLAKMYTYFEDDNYYYIIMDYYEFNLNHFIEIGLSLKDIFKIFEKINNILLELNSKNLLFRNIKPENIFIISKNGNLDGDFELVLSDCCNKYFSLYPKDIEYKKYWAPEIKAENDFRDNSDIWSLGLLFIHMLFFICLGKNEYIYEEKFIQCIKYEKLKKFLGDLLEFPNSRMKWKNYFEEFEILKNDFLKNNYGDLIDFSKMNLIERLNSLFNPGNGFDNIIIQLTELSKEDYVNDDVLTPQDFDKRGNKLPYDYSKEQKRGNYNYYPPLGWTGIGLNITNHENWHIKCGNSNNKDEWCVAYHGTSLSNAKNIIIEGLKQGHRQQFKHALDVKGNIVGKGVYFSPSIKIAEQYATPYEGVKCAFMCRVNPEKMKMPEEERIYVINEPEIDVIPYRLLLKWD